MLKASALPRSGAQVLVPWLFLLLVAPAVQADLGTALDAPTLPWTTGGDAQWSPQNSYDCNGYLSPMGQSGPLTNNQSSTLQTTVTGPGRLIFWWKVSCQANIDYLAWRLNGVEQARLSGPSTPGSGSWRSVTNYVDSGTQTLQWVYARGASGSGGQDAGWVDRVSYSAGTFPPVITAQPEGLNVVPGSNATFSVQVSGAPPFAYQWQCDGTNLAGATDSSLSLSAAQVTNSGLYCVTVTNAYGTKVSSNALLNVFLWVGPQQALDALDRWYFRSAIQLSRVRFVGGLFVGLGPNGLLMTSTNGTTWTVRNSGTSAHLKGVAYGTSPNPLKLFVVVGTGGTVLTSSDAINWSSVTAITQDLNDVAWNGSRFVASATANSSAEKNVFYSNNGTNWTGVTFPSNPDTGFPFITSTLATASIDYFITAGGSQFAYEIWRSINGSTWTDAGFSDATVGGIASGNGCSIVVGYEGWPRVSINAGSSWSIAKSSAIGDTNALYGPMVGVDMTFGNGTFLVARGAYSSGFLATSNGVTWVSPSAFVNSAIVSVAYGNGTFVAACAGGAFSRPMPYPAGIYQSAPVSAPFLVLSRQTNSTDVVLSASGEVNRAYRLQSSPDLMNWTERSSYTYSLSGFQFVDQVAPGTTQLFYRVVSP